MSRFERRAEWIWRQRGLHKLPFAGTEPPFAEEANRYIYFRKQVTLAGAITSANAHISADGRYQLYVNGNRIGRGPARCSPAFQTVDPYDLAEHLRPGVNVIAALVHSYGRHTAWYELPQWEQARSFGCGGFFCQGDIVTEDEVIRLDTGPSWLYREAQAWDRSIPGGGHGFTEIYDARLAPANWHGEIDGSPPRDWAPAEVLRVPARNFSADIVPFSNLVKRDIPAMVEGVRTPANVVASGEVVTAPGDGGLAMQIAREVPRNLDQCHVEMLPTLVQAEAAARIVTGEKRGFTVVLDFGEIVSGRVGFVLDGPAGAVVDFTYGERLQADNRVCMIAGIPGLDLPQAHRYTLKEGPQRWEQFERVGFRFLQLTFRNCTRPLYVKAIHVTTSSYPVAERGHFECADEQLNLLWRVGANTVRQCMHDGFEDCPTREQRQWVADAYLQMLVNFVAFGDTRLAARMLRQIAQTQRGDGLTAVSAPGDFAALTLFNIPDFCLYWILAIEAYVTFSGDTALARELYPAMTQALAWFKRCVDDDSLLTDLPHWVFVDWAALDKVGQVTVLNVLFVAALRAAARLATYADAAQRAGEFRDQADAIVATINELLWDEARGVYVDARSDGVRSRRISQQTNAMVIAFDVAPPERWDRILDRITDDVRVTLTRTGDADPHDFPFDVECQVVLAQPFMMHYLHRALNKAGRDAAMLENIRRHWGALVAEGECTFRETWQINPITSLCHGWSATPTYDLSTYILGVSVGAHDRNEVRIAPQPAGLAWARGSCPTRCGDVAVAWDWDGERFALTIDLPPETEATVVLPVGFTPVWRSITVDGVAVKAGDIALTGRHHRVVARV